MPTSSDSSDDDMDPNLKAALAACAVDGSDVVKHAEKHAEKVKKRNEQKRDYRQPNVAARPARSGSGSDSDDEFRFTEQLDLTSLKIADMLTKILDRDVWPNIEEPPGQSKPPTDDRPASDSEDSDQDGPSTSGQENNQPRTKEEKQKAKKARRRARKLQQLAASGIDPASLQQKTDPQTAAENRKRRERLEKIRKGGLRAAVNLYCREAEDNWIFDRRKVTTSFTFHADDDGRGVKLFRKTPRDLEIVLQAPEKYVLRKEDIKRRKYELQFEGADEAKLAAAAVDVSALFKRRKVEAQQEVAAWPAAGGAPVEGEVVRDQRSGDEEYGARRHGLGAAEEGFGRRYEALLQGLKAR